MEAGREPTQNFVSGWGVGRRQLRLTAKPLVFPRKQREESRQPTPLPNTELFHKFFVRPTVTTENKRKNSRVGSPCPTLPQTSVSWLAFNSLKKSLLVGLNVMMITWHARFDPETRLSIQLTRNFCWLYCLCSLTSRACITSAAALAAASFPHWAIWRVIYSDLRKVSEPGEKSKKLVCVGHV